MNTTSMEKFIAFATVLLGAWLYLIGWAYLNNYLRFFHIDIFEIDLSWQYVIVYAAPPIDSFFRSTALPVVLFAAIFLAVLFRLTKKNKEVLRSILSKSVTKFAVVSACILAVFIGGLYFAARVGESRARDTWTSSAPAIFLSFVPDVKIESGGERQYLLFEENKQFSLLHLLSTRDTHYVFIRNNLIS